MTKVGGYRLGNEIGRGGMGVVYLARHEALEVDRAIKKPLIELPDAATRTQFLTEARVEAQMTHPNIVEVFDFIDEGTPYIVMEYFPRGSLKPVVERLAPEQVGRVLVDLLRGLDHAHRRGIIHRDVKPANLMRTDDGHVKIADFGIARALEEAVSEQTMASHVDGDVGYIAPEAVLSGVLGTAGDLYAVGVVAFELLNGAIPFASEMTVIPDPSDKAAYKTRHPAPSLDQLRPGIDRQLAVWVARLLERDPTKRPQTAHAALDELLEIAPRLWGPEWESASLLPAELERTTTRAEPAPSARLGSWSTVTALAPPTDLVRHALLKPRNLIILGVGVLAAGAAREVTHVIRPWLVVCALAVLYLGSAVVTFFDVAEADGVRRRRAAAEPAAEPPSEDDSSSA